MNKGFTSRPSQWDGADIKHPHDDWNPVPPTHGKKQDADGKSTDAYAPTLIHMRALPAYTGGSSIDNRAPVSLYRNGGGEGREAHDSDAVHQEAAKAQAHPIISLDQTGAAPLLRTAVGLSIASIVAAVEVVKALKRTTATPSIKRRQRCRHIQSSASIRQEPPLCSELQLASPSQASSPQDTHGNESAGEAVERRVLLACVLSAIAGAGLSSGRTASSAGLRPKRDCGRGTLCSRITHIR